MSRTSAVLAATAATIAGAAGCAPSPVQNTADTTAGATVTIERVVDGDTIDVLHTGATDPMSVRILGIDTPETVDPDSPVQCWGPESSAWAHQILDGKTVTLTPDPSQDAADRYGRALRYVTLPDGDDYSVLAAETGMARAYTYGNTPLGKADEIAAAETTARTAGAGLWGACPRGN